MEIQVIHPKSIRSSILDRAGHALKGLYGVVERLQIKVGSYFRRADTGARKDADNSRERYRAQALATGWQGPRYFR